MATRQEVFSVVNDERVFQDRKWGSVEEHPHEVGSWLTIMRQLLNDAERAYMSQRGNVGALDEVRKVVAVGVACMEQHGPVAREAVDYAAQSMHFTVHKAEASADANSNAVQRGSRLVKLDEQGNELPWETRSFAILRHEPAGLLIDLRRLHTGDHASCMRFAGESTLLGRQWRLGTVEEIFLHVADRTRQDPAVDPDIYPMLGNDWIWTSTPDAKPSNPSSPDYAWGVHLYGGNAGLHGRHGDGLALPVSPLAVPAGQS